MDHPLSKLWPDIEPQVHAFLRTTVWRAHLLDLTQDAAEVLLRQWNDDLESRSLEELVRYACGVARNKGRTKYRSQVSQAKRDSTAERARPKSRDLYGEHQTLPLEDRELLARLPQREAEVFRLTAEFGLRRGEVADALGISTSAVKTYITRGRERLRSAFDAA